MNRDFDPQVGDIVRIRDWGDMVAEFGLDSSGDIPCRFNFVRTMKYLCGREFQISKIDSGGRYYGADSVESISLDMIELVKEDSSDVETDNTLIDDFLGTIKVV